MARDIARDQRGAELSRLERRDLLVDRADARALLVVEHRAAERARNMVFGELGGRARIEDRIERPQARGVHRHAEAGRMFHGAKFYALARSASLITFDSAARSADGANRRRRVASARFNIW